MRVLRASGSFTILALATVAACGGGNSISTVSCGSPPPSPHPQLWLVYPIPSATQVPASIGALIFADVGGLTAQDSISVLSASAQVPVGAFTSAPSPLPSPRVTPGADFGPNVPYVAVPVPTLSPSTSYTVNYTFEDWADNPPSCVITQTQILGTLTTQ